MLAVRRTAAPAPGTVIGGRYRVERPLGEGGMGAVVAATHLELHQEVAIKVLLPTIAKSEEANTRFMREGRAAARLTSPYAAKVFDTGRLSSGEPYLVMELLSGHDLRTHMTKVARVPLEQAAEWVLQAAHALGEAHKLKVIHRDVKPANLFLAETSAGVIIKVLDFGVSKQSDDLESDLTNTASMLGTPRYMAPEQMRSARLVDPRCDVWSLGVVLYELTTGEAPFRGDSVTALCFDVMERTPLPPSHHDPALPPAFDAVVARCLAKDPDERFPTMEALTEALRAFAPSPRLSQMLGVPDATPAPRSGGTPPSAGAHLANVERGAAPASKSAASDGLRSWLVGIGVGAGLTGAVVVALLFAEPGRATEDRAAPVTDPTSASPLPSARAPSAAPPTPSATAPAPTVQPVTPTLVSEASAAPVQSSASAQPGSAAARERLFGEPKRPVPGLCNPPTWKDANGRLVPKPYCL